MMLGTNNYKINTPEEIVTGVVQVVSAVRQRQPEAELYVQGIYPRRGAEQDMAELNRNLEARLRQTFGDAVRFINPGEVLLGKDGKVDESLFTGDGLHPCDKGYRLLGKHLKQDLGL
jgi:lysophospholipase L1-like esterase